MSRHTLCPQLRCLVTLLTVACAVLAGAPPAAANNPPRPGSGCVGAAEPHELGAVEDRLSGRRFVIIGGVGPGSPVVRHLHRMGRHVPVKQFLDAPSDTLTESYALLINARHLDQERIRDEPAVVKALGASVPIVLENVEVAHVKAVSKVGLTADAIVVQTEPGGRAVTLTALHHPPAGPTEASVRNAVNRALAKRAELSIPGDPPPPSQQAYAQKVWKVWLHTGNLVCQPPYDPGQAMDPQVGNLDFGVQITLVAGTEPAEKAVNLQYIGTGFSPLAPGVVPIDVNNQFKGAFTLDLAYEGKLTAPSEAKLTGTADTVEPATAVNQHTVTKTNGFTWGLTSSCGGSKTGPNCSIGANFAWTSSRTDTDTIAERVIDATSSFGVNPQTGEWEADHGITYRLSSTATSDNGAPIDLPTNDWYGFFRHGTHRSVCFEEGQYNSDDDVCQEGVFVDGRVKFPSDDDPRVADWPQWAQNAAQTEGMAGYTMDAGFTGDLTLTASLTVREGVFALGHGPHGNRQVDTHPDDCSIYGDCPWWSMNLYTDAFTAASTITIDAADVNLSGMPTCAMLNYTQKDIGIWAIENATNDAVDISKMNAWPWSLTPIPTVPNDYRGTVNYVLGVSATTIQPGQFEFVALCSSDSGENALSMYVEYDNGTGQIGFSGAGNFVDQDDPHLTVNAATRVITINP
jgi:hypothetical protein